MMGLRRYIGYALVLGIIGGVTYILMAHEAQLANARIDLERYQRLAASAATTRQQADTQKALVAQLEAQVKGDQAAIDNAQTTLNYTTITAPLAARTGIRLVDVGNLARAS